MMEPVEYLFNTGMVFTQHRYSICSQIQKKECKMKRSVTAIFLSVLFLLLTAIPCFSAQQSGKISDPGVSITEGSLSSGFSESFLSEKKKKKNNEGGNSSSNESLDEKGSYTSKEDVALFIHLYGRLPDNYITKSQAEKLGWVSSKGNLWDVAPGKSIGGNKFGNYEGNLPEKKGRQYYECDIDYDGGYRKEKRIVYSNDGLVYYTEDHYETLECLYDENGAAGNGSGNESASGDNGKGSRKDEKKPDKDGSYTSKEDVALYIHTYGCLPDNYITKKEAEELGWVSSKGNLWKVAPGMSIGGNRFGNYEGILPEKKGRQYYECDIDFDGSYRNSKRIIFSNDGLIYYTEDHYETFELLYGDE